MNVFKTPLISPNGVAYISKNQKMFERKVVLSLRYDTKPLKFHLNHDYGKTEKKGVTLQQLSLSNEKKDKNKLDKATLTTSEYY